MKYVEFKNHIYKKLINEYDFKKVNKCCVYESEETIILIETQKSSYANDAYVKIGVSPKSILNKYGLETPKRFEECRIYQALRKNVYELDSFDMSIIDEELEIYMINTFPYMKEVSSIKNYYENRKDELMDYMREELFK